MLLIPIQILTTTSRAVFFGMGLFVAAKLLPYQSICLDSVLFLFQFSTVVSSFDFPLLSFLFILFIYILLCYSQTCLEILFFSCPSLACLFKSVLCCPFLSLIPIFKTSHHTELIPLDFTLSPCLLSS